jgi:predicted CoA-binding protein
VHTTRNIAVIVLSVVLVALGIEAAVIVLLGSGLVAGGGIASVVVAHYGLVVRPWHQRWGATDAEAHGSLPGDALVSDAAATTRAVAIAAPPEAVWPWLAQIGWGRAGWYSYDWIDNDGRPSSDEIVAQWQDLAVGDRIPMTPDAGFVVRRLDPPHTLVALSDDGSTSWCLHVVADGDGSRLVSRFRTHSRRSAATILATLVVDPGVFIMERRMLLGIKARAEAGAASEVAVTIAATHRPGDRTVTIEAADTFLEGRRIAVIGASDEKGNMGGAILRELWLHGHDVVPVHPTSRLVCGHRCYPTIGEVHGAVDGAIVVVPAEAAVDVVRQCIAAGVPAVWLFKGIGGEGAVSDEAIALCEEAGVAVVPGACPLMFIRPVGAVHRIHRGVRRARHDVVAHAG